MKEDNITKNENRLYIGDFLKKLRESKNISIHEISQKTKINITMLKALESNDVGKLPNRTYIKGFVKSYVLELNGPIEEANKILNESFRDLFPALPNLEESLEKIQKGPTSSPIKNTGQGSPSELGGIVKAIPFKFYVRAIIGLLTLTLLILIIGKIQEATKSIQLIDDKFTQVPKNIKHLSTDEDKVEESNDTKIAEETSPDIKTESNQNIGNAKTELSMAAPPVNNSTQDSNIDLTKKSKVVDQKSKPEVSNEIKSVADNTNEEKNLKDENTDELDQSTSKDIAELTLSKNYSFSKMVTPLFQVLKDAPENDQSDILPQDIKASIIPGKQNVFINAKDGDTWIVYKNSDGPIKSFTLMQGRTLLIRGEEVRIFFGNVNVAKVFYNNQLIRIDSRNGVKSLVFPEKNANKYVTPLFIRDKSGKYYTSYEYLEGLNIDPSENSFTKSEE